ncbi:hypothetical protein B566_EDAN002627 [Ephemera danica]|nr:hypothetical protein B566_EDAN002627 [Ephemera danica]
MAAVLSNIFERLAISSLNLTSTAATSFPLRTTVCGLRSHPAWSTRQQEQTSPKTQEIVPLPDSKGQAAFKDIASRINAQIATQSHGRLFAVVQVLGKQFKITDEDLIVVEGNWLPDAGDRIRLEKVLLVGGSDFTLLGRPLLRPDLVLFRYPQTTLRINCVRLTGPVDQRSEVEGLDRAVF